MGHPVRSSPDSDLRSLAASILSLNMVVKHCRVLHFNILLKMSLVFSKFSLFDEFSQLFRKIFFFFCIISIFLRNFCIFFREISALFFRESLALFFSLKFSHFSRANEMQKWSKKVTKIFFSKRFFHFLLKIFLLLIMEVKVILRITLRSS